MVNMRRLAAVLLTAVTILISACTARGNNISDDDQTNRLSVVVTFDALYEIAMAVSGGRADVFNIMPDGMEVHDFEPQARDLAVLSSADILIMNGFGLDTWADKAVSAVASEKLLTVDASEGISPIALAETGGGSDPHIWLSPVSAQVMAENIKDALCEADPDGTEHYRVCCNEFKASLQSLYSDYSGKFGALSSKTIVTGHAVFAYLCRDFGLIQNSVEGVFAEGEPSAKAMVELVEFCRENSIKAILAENLSSPLVAETLAAEAGAEVLTIYTMEGSEDGLSFLERMEMNLETILVACNT